MKKTLSLIGIICQIALQVHADPTITTEPTNVITYVLGINATFSVVATGTPPLFYKWKKGSAIMAGETNSSLAIPSVSGTDAAGYLVIVSNSVGTDVSSVAWLRTPPEILVQPKNKTNACGTTATFTVDADGSANLQFFWFSNNVPVSGGYDCSVPNVPGSASGAEYYVTITNDYGSVTSSIAKLYVKPGITQQPASVAPCTGSNATFCVEACGASTLSYKWRRNGVTITGATSSCFTTNTSASSVGTYSVIVSNSYGTVTSANATLTATTNSPSITVQPFDQSVSISNFVRFTVTASGQSLKYQWYKDGVAISAATNSNPAIASVQTSDAGVYSVIVSNACGTVASSNITLTVNSPVCGPLPDTLIAWWQGETNVIDFTGANNGTWLTWTGTTNTYAAGKVGQSFQFVGGSVYTRTSIGFGTFVGNFDTNDFTIEFWVQTSSTLPMSIINKRSVCAEGSFFNVKTTDGSIRFELSDNSYGSNNTFSVVSVPINDGLFHHVGLVRQNTNAYIYIDGLLSASGSGPLPVISISNSALLRIGDSICSGVDVSYPFEGFLDEIAVYDSALTAGEIKDICDGSTLGKCSECNPISITEQPESQTVIEGNNVTFNVRAFGTAQKYQWFTNATGILGATNPFFSVVNAQLTDAATYSVTISNDCGLITSSNATLSVNSSNCVSLPSGLSAWWQAETNANSFTNGYNGSWQTNASYATGKVGQAFQFDGNTNSITFGTNVGNFGTNDFTIEFWINTSSTREETVINKRTVCNTGRFWDVLTVNGSIQFTLFDYVQGISYGTVSVASVPINDGRFHHIGLVRQSTNAYVYVDGMINASGFASLPVLDVSNSALLTIGKSVCVPGAPYQYFTGLLDEIAVYNNALSAGQIKAIYDAAANGKCSSP